MLLLLSLALILPTLSTHAYRWPDPKFDDIEDLYVLQGGFRSLELSTPIQLCNSEDFSSPNGEVGSLIAAEWLKTAFFDFATHNAATGEGGLDGSITFETGSPEAIGIAFNNTLADLGFFVSPTISLADTIALAVVLMVRQCSQPPINIPFRAGRVDATAAGPLGVPLPQQDLATHVAAFRRIGFNVSEMITLVACGHSLGGVRGQDFPNIVANFNTSVEANETFNFDSTFSQLDNAISTEFVSNMSQDPLVIGPNLTNSDLRIFTADGGAVMKRLARSPQTFAADCTVQLEKMINTVPKHVLLTDPILSPIPVKPYAISLQVDGDNRAILSGQIRIKNEDAATIVNIRISTSNLGHHVVTASPFSDELAAGGPLGDFSWRLFNTILPLNAEDISFVVEIATSNGTTISDNGGDGFLVQNTVIFNPAFPCILNFTGFLVTRNFTISVKDSARLKNIQLTFSRRAMQPNAVTPKLVPESHPFEKGVAIRKSGYTFYHSLSQGMDAPGPSLDVGTYDVIAETQEGKAVRFIGFTPADLTFCSG